MRLSRFAIYGCVVVLLLSGGGYGLFLGAEEVAPAVRKPTVEELREQLKKMSPGEREAKLKELRERYGQRGPEGKLLEKRREELNKLSPTERQAKLREWRQRGGSNSPAVGAFSAEEREAKRKELRMRLVVQLDQLRTNECDLSPGEQRRLERLEEVARRFDRPRPGVRAQGVAAGDK